jgi:HPt (histidine-containing phosphotransfer) domain-containing protein
MATRKRERPVSAIAADGRSTAARPVDSLAAKFLRRAATDVIALRAHIQEACRGDAAALTQVAHCGHKLHGTAAMLGFHRISAIGEAIEQLTAGIIADVEAHGPLAESALVQQIADCVEQLAAAVEGEQCSRARAAAR